VVLDERCRGAIHCNDAQSHIIERTVAVCLTLHDRVTIHGEEAVEGIGKVEGKCFLDAVGRGLGVYNVTI